MQHIARFVVWPVVVTLALAGYAFGFASGRPFVTLMLVPVAISVLLLPLEEWLAAVPRSGALRDPQLPQDLLHAVLGQGFGNQVGTALVAGAMAMLLGSAGGRFGLALWPADWPMALQILVGVFVVDGLEYARHRAAHCFAWLWRAHALHHSADRMHVLKSGRGHFLDMVLRHLLVFLPLAAIGTPTVVLLAWVAALTALGTIGHANVDVRVPRFLHRLVMTPQVHRVHHGQEVELALANYANVFPVWDVLFGTFRDPARGQPARFGIEDDRMPTSFWRQIAAPFAWRRLVADGQTEAVAPSSTCGAPS
jgi:sterol desaturase/sphingolipid hydroxylase (fatty acid hydroxylase superfamily)